MELEQAINTRRAVREYAPDPVDEATLRRVIDAATLAPSAVNEQSWLFTVIQDKVAAYPDIRRSQGCHSRRAARWRIVPPPSGDARKSSLRHLLSCASTNRNFERDPSAVGSQELRPRCREPDARRPRRRPRDVLDRLRADLAWHAGRQGRTRASAGMLADRAHHRRHPISFPPAVPRNPPIINWIG